MQWRLLVRRSPMRSFTIVGDIAQASSLDAPSSWHAALDSHFNGRWELEELTVNYRTPAQIAHEAERVAREHGLPITPTRSVREGDWPIADVVAADAASVPAAVERAVRDDLALRAAGAGGGRGSSGAGAGGAVGAVAEVGTLAVIVPLALRDAVTTRLTDAFGSDVGTGARGLERPISVLTAHDSKGLEFDSVVLADPDLLVAESPRGAAALYVAMTRPTQRLTLVRVAAAQA
jgi:hypothetical protein